MIEFCAFGEMLWDCLPSGRRAGGAPFNVAVHLAQLGASSALLSAVGRDPLGDDIIAVADQKQIETRFVSRARADLPTGTVPISIDAQGDARYDLSEPAAWDEIPVSDEAVDAIAGSSAFVFGSLAARSHHNRSQLERLLTVRGPLKCFDFNFRAPYADGALAVKLAKRADVLKLNECELGQIASWLNSGTLRDDGNPADVEGIARRSALLAAATETSRICVTRGARGAVFWDDGVVTAASTPHVTVQDTVGAGDAFMAGLMMGLVRGSDTRSILEHACGLGAFVVSKQGATPPLSLEILELYRPA